MTAGDNAFSLYIHIPYCVSKCPYCNFNSHVAPQIPGKQYTDALLRELDHYGSAQGWQGRPVQSIFFGIGTPSTFKPTSINSWSVALCIMLRECTEPADEIGP